MFHKSELMCGFADSLSCSRCAILSIARRVIRECLKTVLVANMNFPIELSFAMVRHAGQ